MFRSPYCRQSATTTTNPCPSPGPLVSVSGWQPDLTKVITTLPLPRPPAAVMTWSGQGSILWLLAPGYWPPTPALVNHYVQILS